MVLKNNSSDGSFTVLAISVYCYFKFFLVLLFEMLKFDTSIVVTYFMFEVHSITTVQQCYLFDHLLFLI